MPAAGLGCDVRQAAISANVKTHNSERTLTYHAPRKLKHDGQFIKRNSALQLSSKEEERHPLAKEIGNARLLTEPIGAEQGK